VAVAGLGSNVPPDAAGASSGSLTITLCTTSISKPDS
jgi:hypothetical protein